MKKIIFLPIEIKSRELKPKLYLAYQALKKDYYCFIGDKAGIFRSVKYFSPGVYFYKSINFPDTDHIKKIKKLKNIYVVQDEESGFTHSSKKDLQKYITVRSSKINVSLIDKFFNWGQFDFDEWKKRYKDYSYKFCLTGSPRVDLWSPNLIKKIYKKENNHIFLNYGINIVTIISSNITSKNDLNRYLETDKIWFKFRSKKEKENRLKQLKSDLSFHYEFVKMINKISKKNPKINFIVRPHPGESVEDWKKITKKMNSNVILDNNFDITPWLYNSKFVIQSSSSVALQTLIMKKNLITYKPDGFNYNRNYPNKFGFIAKDSNKINTILRNKVKLSHKVKKDILLIKKRITNHDQSTAAKEMMMEISKIHRNKEKINLITFSFLSFLYFIKVNFLKIFKIQKIKKNIFFPQSKIPNGISKKEVANFFHAIDSNSINIKRFGPGCFLLFKK